MAAEVYAESERFLRRNANDSGCSGKKKKKNGQKVSVSRYEQESA